MPAKITTLLAALAVLAVPARSSSYLVPPSPRTEWAESGNGNYANVDLGVTYIDINGDSLVDIVQGYENGGDVLRSWLNTGCQFVDSSTVTPTNPLKYCDIPTEAAHALADARVAALLRGIQLEHYVGKLADHEVDYETLLEMTDAKLEKAGVAAVGAREKILRATKKKVARAAVPGPGTSASPGGDVSWEYQGSMEFSALTSAKLPASQQGQILLTDVNGDGVNDFIQFSDGDCSFVGVWLGKMAAPSVAADARVATFLGALGLAHHAEALARHEVDYATLLALTDAELEKAGVATVGARKKILLAAAAATATSVQ